jgi:hypothetical protein
MFAHGLSLTAEDPEQRLGKTITYITLQAAPGRHVLCGIYLALSTRHETSI